MKPLYDGEFSTLKGEHELVAENVALKEVLKLYQARHTWIGSECTTIVCANRKCPICIKADALLKEN